MDGEDDLYDTLNDSLHRNGLGQAGLDEQMDLGPFGPGFVDDMRADDGLPRHEEYDFRKGRGIAGPLTLIYTRRGYESDRPYQHGRGVA